MRGQYSLEMMNGLLVGLIHITEATDKEQIEKIEWKESLSLHRLQNCGQLKYVESCPAAHLALSEVTESLIGFAWMCNPKPIIPFD